MKSSEGFVRMRTLQGVVLFIFLLIAGRLAYIQLVDSKYNELAKANVFAPCGAVPAARRGVRP